MQVARRSLLPLSVKRAPESSCTNDRWKPITVAANNHSRLCPATVSMIVLAKRKVDHDQQQIDSSDSLSQNYVRGCGASTRVDEGPYNSKGSAKPRTVLIFLPWRDSAGLPPQSSNEETLRHHCEEKEPGRAYSNDAKPQPWTAEPPQN